MQTIYRTTVKSSPSLSRGLLALCGLLALPGCNDQLLPGEPGTQSNEAGRIVFTEIDDMLEWNNNAWVARVGADGSGRVDLIEGILMNTPGAGAAAVLQGNGVWLVPTGGSAPATPQLIATFGGRPGASGGIDGYSVATTPDGSRVTYTSSISPMTSIVGAGETARVVLPRGVARETAPAFSPDGSRLAFFSHDDEEEPNGPGALYVINADGYGLRKVAQLDRIQHDGYSSIDWSPSGDRLVYYAEEDEVRIAAVDGSGARSLVRGISPVWNPAGDSVLYTGAAEDNQSEIDLYMIAADGSGTPRRITRTPTIHEYYARFSPDGKQILYTTYAGQIDAVPGHLTVQDLATGTTKVLSEKAYKGFWVE